MFIIGQTISQASITDVERAVAQARAHGASSARRSSMFRRVVRQRCVRSFRVFLRRFLLLVSLLVQASVFATAYMLDKGTLSAGAHARVLGACVVIQALQAFAIVSTSLKFLRHMEMLSPWFLVQVFLSITMLFAGVYTLVYIGSPGCGRAARRASRTP